VLPTFTTFLSTIKSSALLQRLAASRTQTATAHRAEWGIQSLTPRLYQKHEATVLVDGRRIYHREALSQELKFTTVGLVQIEPSIRAGWNYNSFSHFESRMVSSRYGCKL